MVAWRRMRLVVLLTATALAVTACGDETLYSGDGEHGHSQGELGYWKSADEVAEALEDGVAVVEPSREFQSALVYFTGEEVDLEVRPLLDDEPVDEWRPLEVTTSSERFHRGVVRLDEPADAVELRGEPTVEFARFEFFERRVDEHVPVHDGVLEDYELAEGDQEAADGEYSTRISELAAPGRYDPPRDVHDAGHAQTGNLSYTGAPPWQGGANCSGPNVCGGDAGFLPGTQVFADFLVDNFEGARSAAGYCCRPNTANTAKQSVHGTGRAIDLFVPVDPNVGAAEHNADNDLGDPIANYLIENATELGVEFFVWDRAKWNIERGVCESYGGPHPHNDHLHIELSPEAANDPNFGAPPSSGGDPEPVYDLDLDIDFKHAKNPFDTGSSAAIADVYPGEAQKADIVVTNESSEDLENLVLGYWVEDPYVSIRNYTIYDDHPLHDKQTWKINSADSEPENPPKDAMGTSGQLHMHKFSPGETKRVDLEIVGEEYSVGFADHPDLRVWVRHIDNLYGSQTGYFEEPTNGNAFGRILRTHAEVDVLSYDYWDFRGNDEGDVEGWTAHGDVAEFEQNTNWKALATRVDGPDPRIVSPEGIEIDADRWDEFVMISRAHDGEHTKAIYWAGDGEGFSEDRVVRFTAEGDSDFNRQVVDLGSHPQWSGKVTKLRIDVMEDNVPTGDDSGWYDIFGMYFQSSTEQATNNPGVPYKN